MTRAERIIDKIDELKIRLRKVIATNKNKTIYIKYKESFDNTKIIKLYTEMIGFKFNVDEEFLCISSIGCMIHLEIDSIIDIY